MSSVAEKTVQTTFWGGIDKLVSSGVQFIVAIVLARLLTPSDYGIIALLTFFRGDIFFNSSLASLVTLSVTSSTSS